MQTRNAGAERADGVAPSWCRILWARPADARETHLRLLSETELRRRHRYRRQADVDRFTAAAALLRLAAGELLGVPPDLVAVQRSCPDCSQAHGRPVLPGSPLHVSISHSGQRVGVAVTPVGPVGLDAEAVAARDDTAMPLEIVLHPSELTRFPADDPVERATAFLRTWTRKEAVLKATGDGLRVPMTSLIVSGYDQPARLLYSSLAPQLPSELQLHDLDGLPDQSASVAIIHTGPLTIEQSDGSALLGAWRARRSGG